MNRVAEITNSRATGLEDEMDQSYKHFYFVIDLGRIHARTYDDALTAAYERLRDLPDELTYKPWEDLIRLQTAGPCLPDDGRVGGCEEHDEYADEDDS